MFGPAALVFLAASRVSQIESGYTTLGQAAESLSLETGTRHSVTPEWDSLPVFLAMPGATSAQVKETLSSLVYGKWVEKGGQLVLQPDPPAAAEERKKGCAKWIGAINETLRFELSELKKEGPISDAKAFVAKQKQQEEDAERNRKGQGLQGETSYLGELQERPEYSAARHAIIPVLSQIGARALSDLPFDTRVVFSTKPTLMQRMLPLSCAPILYQFLSDQVRLRKLNYPTPYEPVATRSSGFTTFFGNFEPKYSGSPNRPGAGFLSVTRSTSFNGLICELAIGDTEGKAIVDTIHFVPIRRPAVPPLEFDSATNSLKTEAAMALSSGLGSLPPQRRIVGKYPTSSGEDASIMVTGYGQGIGSPISENLRSTLRDQDTWSILLEKDLLNLAKSQPVAALVTDSCLKTFAQAALQKGGTARELSENPDLEVIRTSGQLIIRPSSPSILKTSMVNRKELREFLASVESSKAPRLDGLVRFISGASGPRGIATYAAAVAQSLYPTVSTRTSMFTAEGQRIVRLWGSLSQVQKDRLLSKQPLSAGQLNANQTRLLSEIIYDSSPHPTPLVNGQPGMESDMAGALAPLFEKERTLLAPRGVEPSGSISLGVVTKNGWLGVDPTSNKRTFGNGEILALETNEESDGFFPKMSPKIFYPAKSSFFMFNIQPNALCAQTAWLEDISVDPKGVDLSQLPQVFRDRAKEAKTRVMPKLTGRGTIQP